MAASGTAPSRLSVVTRPVVWAGRTVSRASSNTLRPRPSPDRWRRPPDSYSVSDVRTEGRQDDVVRPLPVVGGWSAPFWTGGAETELRLPRCTDCKALLHPSATVCPHCLGSDLAWEAVVGTAVVVGCTTNEQMWLPSMPPPYSLAVVSLAAAPDVRLTTNVVGCDPHDVYVGMPVRVTFHQQDDVWFPLFEPDPHGSSDVVPSPPLPEVRVRPPASPDKFEDRVAITGIGMSEIGRRLMRPPVSLTVEACRAAVEDAGLAMDDIDGLSTYPG